MKTKLGLWKLCLVIVMGVATGLADEKPEQQPDVTIRIFSDFQCPFCKMFAPAATAIENKGVEDIATKVEFRNFPLSFHPFAQLAEQAAVAARTGQIMGDSTATLTDGNRVVHRNEALIARDSEGRTRREQTIAGGASIVFIHDPVAGAGYIVDSRTKGVRKMALASAEDKAAEAGGNANESLGIQVLEGIQTEGTRMTHTLAAGEAGNERWLEIATEAWYSNELRTIIMTRTLDPRLGETTYKLTDIKRSEPDRALFQIQAAITAK